MSIDLAIWTACMLTLPNSLPDSEKWHEVDESWLYEGAAWNVTVDPGLYQKVPQEIARKSTSVSYQYILTLEAPKLSAFADEEEGEAFFQKVISKVISSCYTVVVDSSGDPGGPMLIENGSVVFD